MVYPKAFGQSIPRAFDAAFPNQAPAGRPATYLGLPLAPVLQTYDAIGPAAVAGQFAEGHRRGAAAASIYVVETASDAELRAVAARPAVTLAPPQPAPTPTPAAPAPLSPEVLQATALAYLRGAIAILDHGTPAELQAWAELFGGQKKERAQ